MRWEDMDWGMVLLILMIMMLWLYAITACSFKQCRQSCCPEIGHGDYCPICERVLTDGR